MNKLSYSCVVLVGLLTAFGCTSQQDAWQDLLDQTYSVANSALLRLEQKIKNGSIRNVQLLSQYARVARTLSPELVEIVDTLALDATTAGPIFQGLKSRLIDAKTAMKSAPAQGEQAVQQVWSELELIAGAADPEIYGMMLTDPINVLADMSDGRLGRVEAMSKQAGMEANRTTDTGPGGQLIGNPHYGRWQTDSSGNSFWGWYGKYALFSSLLHGPVYYNGWASGRNYSYYHDYGRSHYTSPGQFRSQTDVNNRAKSKFQKTGQSFQSPYAKTKTGAAGTVRKPRTTPTPTRFKSQYQNSSSARSAYSRTSRSSSGGK